MLPYDHVIDFFYRPKPISAGDFEVRKRLLLPDVMTLRKTVKELEEDRNQVSNIKGITGYVKRY